MFVSVQMTDGLCATSGAPFEAADVVPVNGRAKQVAAQKGQAAARGARSIEGSSKGSEWVSWNAERPLAAEQRDNVAIACQTITRQKVRFWAKADLPLTCHARRK